MPGFEANTLITQHLLNPFFFGIPQIVILIQYNGIQNTDAAALWYFLFLTWLPVGMNLLLLLDEYFFGAKVVRCITPSERSELGRRLRTIKTALELVSFLIFCLALFGTIAVAMGGTQTSLADMEEARSVLFSTIAFSGWGIVLSLYIARLKMNWISEHSSVGEMVHQIPKGYKFLSNYTGKILRGKIFNLIMEIVAITVIIYTGQPISALMKKVTILLIMDIVLTIISYINTVWMIFQPQYSIKKRLYHHSALFLCHLVMNLVAMVYACIVPLYVDEIGTDPEVTTTWALLYTDSALFFVGITHQLLYYAVFRNQLQDLMSFLTDIGLVRSQITRYSQISFPGTSILFSVVGHALLANIPIIVIFGVYLSSMSQSDIFALLQLADLLAGLASLGLFTLTFLCEVFTWKHLKKVFMVDIAFVVCVVIFRITNAFQLAQEMYRDDTILTDVFYVLLTSNILFWAMVALVFIKSFDVLASSFVEGDLWGLPHLPNFPAYYLSIDAKKMAQTLEQPYRKFNKMLAGFVPLFAVLMILEGRGIIGGTQVLDGGLATCFIFTLVMLVVNLVSTTAMRLWKPKVEFLKIMLFNTAIGLAVLIAMAFAVGNHATGSMSSIFNVIGAFFIAVFCWFLWRMSKSGANERHCSVQRNAMVAWRRAERDPFHVPTLVEVVVDSDDGNPVVVNATDTPRSTLPEFLSLRRNLVMGSSRDVYVRRLNTMEDIVWTRVADLPMESIHQLSLRRMNSQMVLPPHLSTSLRSQDSLTLPRFLSTEELGAVSRSNSLPAHVSPDGVVLEMTNAVPRSISYQSQRSRPLAGLAPISERLNESGEDYKSESLDGSSSTPMATAPTGGIHQSPTVTEQNSNRSLQNKVPATTMGPWLRDLQEDGTIVWLGAKELTNVRDLAEGLVGVNTRDLALLSTQDFATKKAWVESQLKQLRVEWDTDHKKMTFRRQRLLKEAQEIFMTKLTASDFRQYFRFAFTGEEALDAGGVAREFWQLCAERVFDPANGLFEYAATDNITLTISSKAKDTVPDWPQAYRFVGRFLAKAIFDFQIVPAYLTRPLYKHILGIPVLFSDLQFIDRSVLENLQWIDQNTGVDALFLDFSISEQVDGRYRTTELKEGGADITVDDTNKEEYIDLYVRHIMLNSISDQLAAMLQGFYDVIPIGLISILDFQELELLMCGLSEIDVEDWKQYTVYTGYAQAQSPVVKWFWEVMAEFTDEQRARLLQFVTGTSRVPVGGFRALQGNDGERRNFTINGLEASTGYPVAHTCFNRIDMPSYSSKQRVQEMLYGIIQIEVTGFSIE